MTEDEISATLSRHKLGARLVVTQAIPNYQWLSMAEAEAKRLCACHSVPVSFAFAASEKINAVAVPSPALIVMTGGCFDFLCRLTNAIVSNGIFTDIDPRTAAVPGSEAQVDQTIRSILHKQQWFDPAATSWPSYSEKEGVFCFVLLSLFRFVILHEMGHIVHQHGRRSHLSSIEYLMIDGIEPSTAVPDSILDSHAREIVADKTAMQLCHGFLEEQYFALANHSDIQKFARTYLDTAVNRIIFLIQIAYIYFAAVDRFEATPFEQAATHSHPPAPFRATTIATTALEGYKEGPQRTAILRFLRPAENMLALALGRGTSRIWIEQLLEDPRYKAHYEALFERVNRWSTVSQTARRSL